MTPNPYNKSQWNWIADRFSEGYQMGEIADFLGMCQPSVKQNLIASGRLIAPSKRVSLEKMKREFNALAGDGSPRINNYLRPVIGTDERGNEVYFESISEAERSLGISRGGIAKSIKKGFRCRGYEWRKVTHEKN